MIFELSVEAMGYGDLEGEVAALEEALAEYEADMEGVQVLANETRGLLMVRWQMEALHGVEAHDVAYELWSSVWREALGDKGEPEVLCVKAVPA